MRWISAGNHRRVKANERKAANKREQPEPVQIGRLVEVSKAVIRLWRVAPGLALRLAREHEKSCK
jgi:hypothetical protein